MNFLVGNFENADLSKTLSEAKLAYEYNVNILSMYKIRSEYMQLTNHLLGNWAENKMLELYSRIDRWMTCDYTSFSTVFQ